MAILTQNKAKLCKKIDHNIGFWEKRRFFAYIKLSKITENYHQNFDPWNLKTFHSHSLSVAFIFKVICCNFDFQNSK
jgi:hypothetical protein